MTEAQQFEVPRWLVWAQIDYLCAHNMAEAFYPAPMEIICYHCQQCAEKALKGFAIANGWTLNKSHDIEFLIEQCKVYDPSFTQFYDNAPRLSMYAVLTRYPDSTIEITKPEMKKALSSSKEILEYAKQRLSEIGYSIPHVELSVHVPEQPTTKPPLKAKLEAGKAKAASNPPIKGKNKVRDLTK